MIWVGTSGYNYVEWRGTFYPPALPSSRMLEYYSARLSTVEINYSFYRMPSERTLDGWLAAVPENFRLTLKAPKRITHDRRLRDCGAQVAEFCRLAGRLGSRLGALLFQLPPSLKKDLPLLDGFLQVLPPETRAAIEFRHPSWHEEDVFERLRRRNVALCIADSEKMTSPLLATAGFGYYRLRDEGYTPEDLWHWARTIKAEWGDGREAFVYFKHEEAGKGPEFARALIEKLGET
ncbi:MAG: DUF72 domain-containing protein [Acidobacteria bacterium]|nr:MAG: DUF72 domain-containing protein [Acidobacteriota bacterium]